MPKTKIICTIGPASDTTENIRKLIQNGMSVARLNFSHGTHEEHLAKIKMIRTLSDELDKPVAILQDLCGPKIRTGRLGPSQVETGARLRVIDALTSVLSRREAFFLV